ncbi:trafficking protein particle complex subunit 8-like [Diadema setosum]|uniref:trafficking protein particle complex subunit 8-like n=1 Tax=Diadema setosum TaxID=31175 RepID=UPI003B3BA869
MAQCSLSAREFIQNTFGPTVAVVCSHDAEVLAQKNNLSFVEMLRPFCRLTSEAHIRDPAGQSHSIHNLCLIIQEMNTQPPSAAIHKKLCHDAVQNSQLPLSEGQSSVLSVGSYDLQISASTPWYEAYRESVLQSMATSDHEFIRHFVACMLVVSTGHADPMDQFAKLSQQQHHLQHSSNTTHPKWLCPNIFKYYVLLHDNSEGEEEKADAIYQSMKSTYGSHACHLLRINSRAKTTVDATSMASEQMCMPDPWSQYLNKVNQQDPMENDASPANDPSMFPDQVSEGTSPATEDCNIVLTPNSSEEDIVMVQVDGSPNSEMVPHPLADVDSQSNHTVASPTDPLSNPPTDPLSNPPTDPLTDSLITNNANGSNSVPQTGKGANQGTAPAPVKTPGGSNVHGAHLTLSDHDRLRIFVHEFVVRGLLPYIERMIRSLSEQLASRKGIQRSLFNATKKLFMGNKQNEKLLSAPQSDSSPKYLRESPEIQMRRRADLAFMVQMYELAYTSYHTAKGDFGNDQAWMHYAGSLEFAAISAFMLGHIQKSYPSHYMENAVTTYLTTCKQPHLATRAVLIGTEIQKARFMYSEAALEFIRLTGEDSDLRSALFLEQAAHCFINSSRPMVRKYAFHMILAGHRFSKAGQRKHALRSYCQALQVYKGKGWALAEDHINLTVGRQSFNLKQLENATAAFKHLLTRDSRQPAVQQVAFLREYLAIFKQLLTIQYADGQTLGALPQLPLPVIKKSATRILLASPDRPQYSDNRVAATSVTFGCIFNKTEMEEWCSMEEAVTMAANKTKVVPSWFQFHPQLLHSGTDNSISPVGILGEPMTVELVLENPLKISLVLTNITLLWKFLPVNYEGGNQENPEHQPQVLTNEPHVSGSDVPGVDSAVKVQCIPEVVLAGNDYKLLRLGLTPLQTGELHIVGVAYNLSAQSSGQTTGQGSDPLNQEVVNAHGRPVVKRPVSFTSGPAQVQGRQDLDIQGPRLNSTKAERCGMLYGPDRRLDPVIAPHMPLLEVTFSSMPSNLMCGEIVKVTMEISNVGKCPLHKLHTIVDRPEIFSFVSHAHEVSSNSSSSQSQTSSISDSSVISQSADGHSGRTIPISEEGLCAAHSVDTGKCNVSSVSEIVLPEGQLAPGCSLQMPMWIRGPDDSGLHDVRVLFFYETTEENTQIRHRTLQHTATIHTSNSVSLTARADRAHTIDGRTSDSHDPNSLNLVVSLTVENMNQVHDSSITEISLQQVTSVSPWWRLSPLSGMESGVSLPFSSMGTPVGSGSTAENGTQGWLAPGGQTQSGGPLQECCAADLALLVLWKAFVVDEEGRDHTLYGQSHLLLDQLSAEVLSHPVRKLPVEQKQIKFAKQPVSQDPVLPSPGVMTSLVKYSLKYSEMLQHDFTRNRICPLPVMLTLCNCTDSALDVVIETTSAIENESTSDAARARVGPPSSLSTSSSGFSWVGQSSRHLSLACRQDQQVQILSCCSQPGVFDLSGLRVLAAPAGATWAREPVLQQRMSSCLLTVTAV